MAGFLDRLRHRLALARWRRAADLAGTAEPAELRSLRTRARQLGREIDRFLRIADDRLARPLIGTEAIARPAGSDWAWRPEPWRFPIRPAGHAGAASETAMGEGVRLFHDCRDSSVTIRQLRNRGADDLAPYGLSLDVLGFGGSFLSLAVDLPGEGLQGIGRGHILRLACRAESERPIKIFARLNLKHGPNTATLLREMPDIGGERLADMDLGESGMDGTPAGSGWLDLIFEAPAMSRVILRDVTLSRRLRAGL